MKYTPNLSLKKPEYWELADIEDINENMDVLDEEVKNKADKTQVLTNVPVGAKFTDTIYAHPSSHSADMIVDGTTNKTYTATEKTKLSSISSGAEVFQNMFRNVKVGDHSLRRYKIRHIGTCCWNRYYTHA